MKIKIIEIKPEEIVYVVIYRDGRNPKKVKISNMYYKCVDKLATIKSVYIGNGVCFSHHIIPKWTKWKG